MQQYIELVSQRLAQDYLADVMSKMIIDGSLKVMSAFFVLAIFYLLWWIVQLVMNATIKKKLDQTSFSFFRTIVKFSLISIALVSALDSAGIKTSAILASLGVVGLTIGFAAKDALSNLISGILIYIDRPFVLGDLVEIEGTYGRVDRITLRSTRVVTSDGKMLAVPNTEIINKTVTSYTNFPNLRLDVQVTVAPSENIDNVRNILLAIVANDPSYMTNKAPRVVVAALNDYNICLELQAWLIDEKTHIEKRFELREKIFNALVKNGVEMPYQTIQIQPVDVRLKK